MGIRSTCITVYQMSLDIRVVGGGVQGQLITNLITRCHGYYLAPTVESSRANELTDVRGRSGFDDTMVRIAGGCSWACSSTANRSLPRRIWLFTVLSGIPSIS